MTAISKAVGKRTCSLHVYKCTKKNAGGVSDRERFAGFLGFSSPRSGVRNAGEVSDRERFAGFLGFSSPRNGVKNAGEVSDRERFAGFLGFSSPRNGARTLDAYSRTMYNVGAMGNGRKERLAAVARIGDRFELDDYLDHPLLSSREEQELTAKWIHARELRKQPPPETEKERNEYERILAEGESAKEKLILCNLRLVAHVVSRFTNYVINGAMSRDDLMQEGTLGLLRAIEDYDPSRGARFSTYATWWIQQHITRAIANKGSPVRLPVYLQERLSRIRRSADELTQKLGREPTIEELAQHCGMRPSIVAKALVHQKVYILSLEQNLYDEQETDGRDMHDTISNPNEDGDSDVVGMVERSILMEQVVRCLDRLSPQERDIVRMWTGLDDGNRMAINEIANVLCTSERMVRNILQSALRKLLRLVELDMPLPRQTARSRTHSLQSSLFLNNA